MRQQWLSEAGNMAKSIQQRIMEQGLMMVSREFMRDVIKRTKPKIIDVLSGVKSVKNKLDKDEDPDSLDQKPNDKV